MRRLSIDYSDGLLAALNLSPEAFEREARIALAMKLYELGRLTSGQAASLAGIPRVTFLLTCQYYGVSAVEWDQSELEAEFKDME